VSEDVEFLLDEHVGRVFERVLREQGYRVEQAKDRFGEGTDDGDLLRWCGEHDTVLVTNNAKDFELLHREYDHAGLLLFFVESLPDTDPEGLARTVDELVTQYGAEGLENQVVDLDAWHDWHRRTS
jgi:hypothetical protein